MRCQRNDAAPGALAIVVVAVAASAAGVSCARPPRAPGGATAGAAAVAAERVDEYLGTSARAAADSSRVPADPRTRWTARTGKGSLGAPAVGDRVVAVATVDRWLYALDARTGAQLWRYRGDAPFAAGPLMDGGRLYAAEEGVRGNVLALSLADGKRRWRAAHGDVTSPMALAGDALYGVTQHGGVAFALDAATGRTRWRRVVGASRSGVLVTGGRVALATITDSLVVLDAASGRVRLVAALPSSVVAPLARIDDSTAAATSPAGAVMALSLATGRVLWSVPTGEAVHGSPAVVGDTVFAISTGCKLWAVPTATRAGAPARADTVTVTPPSISVAATPTAPRTIGGPSRCTTVAGPTLVPGGVLVATVGGEVLFFDRAARRAAWARQLRGELRHPVILRNGQIVVAPLLGDVVSLR